MVGGEWWVGEGGERRVVGGEWRERDVLVTSGSEFGFCRCRRASTWPLKVGVAVLLIAPGAVVVVMAGDGRDGGRDGGCSPWLKPWMEKNTAPQTSYIRTMYDSS